MTIACVGSTAGFQPLMVPSSVSKIRRGRRGLAVSGFVITKSDVGL